MNKQVNTPTQLVKKLNSTKGRFVTINVASARNGVRSFSGKVQSVSEKTLLFWDTNSKRSIRASLSNVSVA